MTKKQKNRQARLMPNGVPRYVRIYDSNYLDDNDQYHDHITVVFSGKYPKNDGAGWYVLGMGDSPFSPQGFCQSMEYPGPVDTIKDGKYFAQWAPAIGRKCHLGKRIPFSDLNTDCQKVILQDYCDIWDLEIPE